MSDEQHPTPVPATKKLPADLDGIVSSVGNSGPGWSKAGLRRYLSAFARDTRKAELPGLFGSSVEATAERQAGAAERS